MSAKKSERVFWHSAMQRMSAVVRPGTTKQKMDNNEEHNMDSKSHLICRPEDNPNYILKACAKGWIDVVSNIVEKDTGKLQATDDKKWTCLHHAVNSNKMNIVDMLLSLGADINAKDIDGQTALHIAASKGFLEAVRLLLTKNANTALFDNKGWAPIHVAVLSNKPHIIVEMSKFKERMDFCIKSDKGCTPLHLAAKMDFVECALELMKACPNLCTICHRGLTPLHIAAKHKSSITLEALLHYGELIGYTSSEMLSVGDKEGNSPLHIAVSSGDLYAAKVCLEHGAEIEACQENQQNALHFACSQGILPIVRLMYETHLKRRGDDEGRKILASKDVSEMTPLHRAALFDHDCVVAYLIEQGSNVNARDVEQRTPLLLAAYKKSLKSMGVLLAAGADTTAKDAHQRNFMHYLVTKRTYETCALANVKELIKKVDLQYLINEKDVDGCSPLHYASKDGSLKFAETLIDLGATVNLKDNDEQSPLHFAAKYGRFNTAKRLLESQIGLHIINESDERGLSALHVASANGHAKIVQMLCERGALIHKNNSGFSPLHLASQYGHVETMNILLSFHSNLLDQVCHKKYTPLHMAAVSNQTAACELLLTRQCKNYENEDGKKPLDLAIENGCSEAALVFVKHDRWNEFLRTNSKLYTTPLHGFAKIMPECYKAVLDRCHTKAQNIDPRSKDYWEKFDFRYLQAPINEQETVRVLGEDFTGLHLAGPNAMVKYGRIELLSHPVCLNYLRMKWRAYGYAIFMFQTILYVIFVALLTYVIFDMMRAIDMDKNSRPVIVNASNQLYMNLTNFNVNALMACRINLYAVLVFLSLNLAKEFAKIYQQRLEYFFDYVNFIEWALYVTTFVYVIPIAIGNVQEYFHGIQLGSGAVAIFLAYFNLLLHMEWFDSIGIYVIMFRRILSTIVKVIFIFSILFIAFAMAFYIILYNNNQGGFETPILSMIHTVMFMMGDWNYVEVYQKPYLYWRFPDAGVLLFPELNFGFLILFVILIPILFINLLIGLAVGDIEMVRRDAQLRKLAMQVDYHTKLEPKLPLKFLIMVDKEEYTLYPNCTMINYAGFLSKFLTNMRRYMGLEVSNSMEISTSVKIETKDETTTIERTEPSQRNIVSIQRQLDEMNGLLKLIIKKMEISQEADYYQG